jgi:Tol biopolymer transport system component
MSRDGRLLAYASDRAEGRGLDIWVQQLEGGEPLAVTDDPADDHSPDFSPDGTLVAFQSERAGGGIFIVPTLGGQARLIARGGRRPRFSPDGTRLAYWTGLWRGDAANTPSSAYIVPLSGGEAVRIAAGFPVAREPVWAPDGRSLLIYARRDLTSPLAEALDWWWVPLDGRPPLRTGAFGDAALGRALPGPDSAAGPAAWSEDGVVFSDGANLWVLPMDASDGRRTGAPRRLTLGPDQHTAPAAGPDGQVVFASLRGLRVVERVRLEPGAADQPPLTLHRDGAQVTTRASQTRDGSVIVFERGLPPRREVWLKDLRAQKQTLLLRVPPSRIQVSPTIAADASRVAYTQFNPGPGRGSPIGYVIETAGGVPRVVCNDCALFGFLADGRRVLAAAERGAVIRAIDLESGVSADLVVATGRGLGRPHASPDDRLLAFNNTEGETQETYVVPLTPGRPATRETWQQVDEPTTTGRPCGWSPDSRTLYLLLDTDGFRCLWGQRVDSAGRLIGSPQAVRHFHKAFGAGFGTGFGDAITRDGFMYEGSATTGNIWRLVRQPPAGSRPREH